MTDTRTCVVSETGRRDVNQDRACVEPTVVAGEPGVVIAVADGMGGMRAGDKAAEIAIATVREYATRGFADVPVATNGTPHALWQMFQDANARVWQWAQGNGCAGETGTTLVCCLVFGSRFVVAHTGDSRCYYVNDHEVRLLTEDHTRVQDLLRRNLMTPEAARRSPFRNELIHSLGEPVNVQVDVMPDPARLGVIDEPCVLLVTSDGVHGHVTDEDIQRALRSTPTVAEAGGRLVATALAHGSTDNATVAAIECGQLRSRLVASAHTVKMTAPVSPVTVKLRPAAATAIRPRRTRRIAAVAVAALLGIGGLGLASTSRGRALVRGWVPDAVAGWGASALAIETPPVAAPRTPGDASAETAAREVVSVRTTADAGTAPAQPGSAIQADADASRTSDLDAPAIPSSDTGNDAATPPATVAVPPAAGEPASWEADVTAVMSKGRVAVTWMPAPGSKGYWLEIARRREDVGACGELPKGRNAPPLRTNAFAQASFVWTPTVEGGIYLRVVSQSGRARQCSPWVSLIVPREADR